MSRKEFASRIHIDLFRSKKKKLNNLIYANLVIIIDYLIRSYGDCRGGICRSFLLFYLFINFFFSNKMTKDNAINEI